VEADALEARGRACRVEPPPESRIVEVVAHVIAEDESVRAREPLAATELVEHRRNLVDHRDAPHPTGLGDALRVLNVGTAHMNQALLEVDVAPPQGPAARAPGRGV
jgi:hypothetical protein